MAHVVRNIHFFPHVYQFSQWIRAEIFQITTEFLIIYQSINISTQETYPSSFVKKVGTLYHKSFWKHPLFITFSLFSTVSEVYNISNKYWLPNKSSRKHFNTRHYTRLLHLKKVVLSIREVCRNIHLYHILTIFNIKWGVKMW